MATELRTVDLIWPYKGMNTETPQSELTPEESPNLENVVVTPQEIRPRRGMKRKFNHGQYHERVHDDIIIFVGHVNEKLIIVTRDNTDSSTHAVPYYIDTNIMDFPSGYSSSAGTTYRQIWSNTFTNLANGSTSVGVPFGRGINFDSFLWTCGWNGGLNVTAGGYRTAVTVGTVGSCAVGGLAPTLTGLTATGVSHKDMIFRDTSNTLYKYRITAHTASTDALTIHRPYGYGDPAAVALTGGTGDSRPTDSVGSAPSGIATLEVYQNRLFGGRAHVPVGGGSVKAYHANAVVWSYPGNGCRWPAQNYIVVDEDTDDPITGMGAHASGMLIFKRNKTYILTGTDESNFQVLPLDASIGCISDTSIYIHNGVLYWMAEEGVMTWDGREIKNITSPGPGRGIFDQLMAYRNAAGTSQYRLRSYIRGTGDYIFVTENDFYQVSNNGSVPDTFVYNTVTGAWSKFTSSSNHYRPVALHKWNDRLYAITQNFVADITDCYETADSATASTDYYDEGYASTSTSTSTVNVVPEVEMIVTPYNRDTARVQEMEIFHNCQYGNATSSPRDAYTVTIASDPTYTASATLSLNARYAGNTSTPTYTYYYSQRFTEATFPLEGAVFKVVLTGASTAILSGRVLRTRLYLQPQYTRHGRVDTASL